MENKKDYVNTNGKKWEFNEEVTNVFGDMLSRSIPNYDTMRELCFMIGSNFIGEFGKVCDIGCSNGLSSEKFINNFPNASFMLCDISQPMINSCKEKYKDYENVEIINFDLKQGMPSCENDLVIASLTLQFTPIEYRWNILQSIYDSLKKDKALILVEKILGNSAKLDNILVKEYYNIKRKHGYSEELIQNKRKSLEGVLVPLTSHFNEHLLTMCGFNEVDCFWRCLNFCAWIAIK